MTDAVQFGFNLMRAYVPVAPLLQNVLNTTGNGTSRRQSIVDLCSGGGGPWPDLSRQLRDGHAGDFPGPQICLTDKYPNLEAFQNISGHSDDHITYYQESVDAMNVPHTLKGMRTMFTSFHHFPPDVARAILQNAVDAGESIGVFEITRRTPATIGIIFIGTLLLFLHTPRIRPFRWSRLLWTYLIPIIPFILLFDGIVSCLRTYRPEELRGIVETLTGGPYHWEVGDIDGRRAPVTYLIGYPK